jgi:hypothetical protein
MKFFRTERDDVGLDEAIDETLRLDPMRAFRI